MKRLLFKQNYPGQGPGKQDRDNGRIDQLCGKRRLWRKVSGRLLKKPGQLISDTRKRERRQQKANLKITLSKG